MIWNKKLQFRVLDLFLSLYISERTMVWHYARSVGTLPDKCNNNGTILQGAFKTESSQKPTKPTKSSTISKNGTTKKTTVTFLTWYRHFPRKMVGSDSRLADATRLALRRYQVYKHSVHVNSLTLRHDQMWN